MVNKYTKYIRNRAPRPELHDKILLATKAMFYKQGIKQVRMDDIAKELTISKRTLYEIFNDKETLFVAAIRARCEGWRSRTCRSGCTPCRAATRSRCPKGP